MMNKVLIYSNEHNAWWKPGYAGYTEDKKDAGVFDYEEACKKYPNIDYDYSKKDYFVDTDFKAQNCRIDDIYLEFDEDHYNTELRVNLDCEGGMCSFFIPLYNVNKFMRDFYKCFDAPITKVEELKGRYLRAQFTDRLYLSGVQHITKDYAIYLGAYKD